MFSAAFVCLFAGLHKKSDRFSQNSVDRWHIGAEETRRFWW